MLHAFCVSEAPYHRLKTGEHWKENCWDTQWPPSCRKGGSWTPPWCKVGTCDHWQVQCLISLHIQLPPVTCQIISFSADDNDALLQLKSLQSLCISGSNTLQSLPSTLSSMQSLHKLVLWNCPALESLAEEPLPLSVRKIEVALCHPLLKERLVKEYGVDWPKIAHIPWIEIDGEILQRLQIWR